MSRGIRWSRLSVVALSRLTQTLSTATWIGKISFRPAPHSLPPHSTFARLSCCTPACSYFIFQQSLLFAPKRSPVAELGTPFPFSTTSHSPLPTPSSSKRQKTASTPLAATVVTANVSSARTTPPAVILAQDARGPPADPSAELSDAQTSLAPPLAVTYQVAGTDSDTDSECYRSCCSLSAAHY